MSAGLLLSGSCAGREGSGGSGGGDAPRLIAASFVNASTVRLQFSEPVTPQSTVDPTQFRLSIAGSYSYSDYGYSYEGTTYLDAGYWAGSTIECYEYCDYYDPTNCQEYCYPTSGDPLVPVVTANITATAADTLELTLSPGIDPATCTALQSFQDQGYVDDIALFVHYSNNGGQIRDRDGNALEAIAEHWVITGQDSTYLDGDFPHMNPFLPMPCPG